MKLNDLFPAAGSTTAPKRLGRGIGGLEILHVSLHVVRHRLPVVQDEEGLARLVPTGRSSHPMDIAVLTQGQMIVDDILNIGNVKAAAGQVGTYQHIGRTV